MGAPKTTHCCSDPGGGRRSFKPGDSKLAVRALATWGPVRSESSFSRDAALASSGVQDQPEPPAEERECDPGCLQRNRDGREDNQE